MKQPTVQEITRGVAIHEIGRAVVAISIDQPFSQVALYSVEHNAHGCVHMVDDAISVTKILAMAYGGFYARKTYYEWNDFEYKENTRDIEIIKNSSVIINEAIAKGAKIPVPESIKGKSKYTVLSNKINEIAEMLLIKHILTYDEVCGLLNDTMKMCIRCKKIKTISKYKRTPQSKRSSIRYVCSECQNGRGLNACEILYKHHEDLKEDDDRLPTEWIKNFCHIKGCEEIP